MTHDPNQDLMHRMGDTDDSPYQNKADYYKNGPADFDERL